MTRLIVKWFASVLLLWAAQLVGIFAVPIALLWTRLRRRSPWAQFPRWAWPWDNRRHPFGDVYWYRKIEGFKGKSYRAVYDFWPRFRWLALRNRAHNLSEWLGVESKPGDWVAAHVAKGNGLPNDDRRWTGVLFVVLIRDGWTKHSRTIAWEFYGVQPYPFTGGKWGIRWRLGWKIKGEFYEDNPHRLVCNVMPLRRIG